MSEDNTSFVVDGWKPNNPFLAYAFHYCMRVFRRIFARDRFLEKIDRPSRSAPDTFVDSRCVPSFGHQVFGHTPAKNHVIRGLKCDGVNDRRPKIFGSASVALRNRFEILTDIVRLLVVLRQTRQRM